MLSNRIKQFREYNGLSPEIIAESLGVNVDVYNDFEVGKQAPSIDIIEKLCKYYKVTTDEFYGYTPRLTLYDKNAVFSDDNVDEKTFKMSDLNWEEQQLILYFRSVNEKDDLISEIIKRNFPEKHE